VDLFDMFITEVTFPSLDRALEGETAYMKVGNLTPNIRMNAGSGESYAPHAQEDPRPIEVDRFQLELQGLPDVAGAVASVGEVTIRAASDSEPATAVIAATVPDFMTEMISMSLEPERTQKLRAALVAYSGPIDDQSMVFRMQMAIPQQVVSVDTVGTPGGYKEITFVGDVVDLVFPATELEFDIDEYRDFLKPIAQKIADAVSSDPAATLAEQSSQIDDIVAATGGQDSLSCTALGQDSLLRTR
jgi:hypothetical protein